MSGEEHERLMDDPETLDGRASPSTVTMYRTIQAEGYAFLFQAPDPATLSSRKSHWIHPLRTASAAPSRSQAGQHRPVRAMASTGASIGHSGPQTASPGIFPETIGADGRAMISTRISRQGLVGSRPARFNAHQSQYRYRHNGYENFIIKLPLRTEATRPDSRLARFPDDTAGRQCVE